jgi:small subunit ribosomal protein S18
MIGPRDMKKDKDKQKKRKKIFHRRKVCRFCADSSVVLDYKEVKTLQPFITERGKIIPRRISGNCAKHQRKLTLAIKRARMIALMPYVGTMA